MLNFFSYMNEHFILYVLSISLLILLLTASRIDKKDKFMLILVVVTTLALSIFEYLEIIFSDDYIKYKNFPRYLFSVLSYILRPIIIVMFYYIRLGHIGKKWQLLLWLGTIFNTIVYTLSLFSYWFPDFHVAIMFSNKNFFLRGPLGYTAYYVCGVYLVALVIVSLIETRKHKTRRQLDAIVIYTVAITMLAQAISTILSLDYSYTSEAGIIGSALYFIYAIYDKSSTEVIEHEREKQANTTALMLSQIQPHFIYNTLATIQVLCEIDPEKAASTIAEFSKYLRMNTDALSKTEPVSVTEEVKHAMAYSKIEMIRFENIKVSFDIKDKDFRLPVLTIEPIVENAIKYGVRPVENGLVEVLTYKEDNKHVLVIKDNGVGFNIENIDDEKRNHVGIENVRTRIINMVGGTFKIESEINKGTTVTITVPEA